MGSSGWNGPGRRLRASLILCGLLTLAGVWSVAAAQEPGETPSEGRLLVLNKGEDTLTVLDVPSYRALATIPVGKEPHEVVATPDGRKAYVSNVRDKTLTVARTLRSDRFDSPHGLAMTPDGRFLLVTSEGSHRFFLIDAARDVVLR